MKTSYKKPKFGTLNGCGCGVGRLPKDVPLYTGQMRAIDRSKLDPIVRSAYDKHNDQFSRCYKPNHVGFSTYGAKGIRVCYGRREFVSWYLHHIKKFTGERPSVDRVDSSKHYCFCNIRIIEWKENLKDGAKRGGLVNAKRLIRPVAAFKYKTKTRVATFNSIIEAARSTGVRKETISRQCVRKRPGSGEFTGIYFRYLEEAPK